ncbi:LPXTG cell wall anchor domain-containing protein [Leifsonia sp. NPDC058194]|uniref:LPXTG cell wall anchor domain-containing protein n=1 Tax=Leifsonia sp. NPDC058194 TaxID=3346374 RepID=UPI0036DA4F4C
MSHRRSARRRGVPLAVAAVAAIAAVVLPLVSAPAAVAAGETLAIDTFITTEKVGLADGRFGLTSVGGETPGDASVGEAGSTLVQTLSAQGTAQVITYRIVLQGTPTDYWVRATVAASPDTFGESLLADHDCTVFRGDPDAGGVAPDSDVPYSCDSDATDSGGADGSATVTFTVRDNIQAEVLGVIKPVGTVSMDSGYFDLSTVHAVPGSTTIAPPYTADFDAILRPGDVTTTPGTARGVFAYRILDGGVPSSFWVAGMASNTDGIEYDHTSNCDIYDVDPIPTLLSGDPAKPAAVSPYACDMAGTDIGGRGSWQVTFTVSARDLHVVTGTYDQADLINRLCTTSMDDCGVDHAVTSLTWADPVEASSRISNPTDLPINEQLTASHTSTVTTTVGVSLSLEAGIGEFFKLTAAASLSVAIATSNTYSQRASINIPPHTTGWWAMSTQMVHAVGDVIVRDGDTYYLLPNVTADFPVAGVAATLTPVLVPLEGSIGGEEPPASGGGSVPAAQPGTAAPVADPSSGAAHAAALADTGSSRDATPAVIALLALLVGAGLLSTRRRPARR